MKPLQFTCSLWDKATALPHFWEHTVGSGHAPLALRGDWQQQLRECRTLLGFRHTRFHGLLCDEMGTLMDEKNQLLYSFFNADQICDFHLSIGMKPFVELSFMPSTLASGDKTVFHYGANVTPPKDYGQWATLVSRLATHWVERYGIDEVGTWFFEVWNEPNLPAFWTGTRGQYFDLYRCTALALKDVDARLQVGGPATANNEWITEFVDFCEHESVPLDFVSTHHYPTDALGSIGEDTETQLAHSRRSILREWAQETHRKARGKPVYYTEWSSSSNPRDHLHDEPYTAAVVVKTMMEAIGLVQGYSFWTFTDIFEENYMPATAFQGGFGLLTLQGVPKPSFRAFELLHRLGTEALPVTGEHDTVDVWVVRGRDAVTVVLTNHVLPRHPIRSESVRIQLTGLLSPRDVYIERIDDDHANARKLWVEMGSPALPRPREVEQMRTASQIVREPLEWNYEGDTLHLAVTMPAHAIAAITVELTRGEAMKTLDNEERPSQPATKTVITGDPPIGPAELEQLQRETFGYFVKEVNPRNGLIADKTQPGAPSSIAAVGLALSAYPVGVARGFMSRTDAVQRTLATLRFFDASVQGTEADATGYKGFYYHFLDMRSGRRVWECELSTVDTAFLLAGMLTAAAFFLDDTDDEREIRELADKLYRRTDWQWAQNGGVTVCQGWRPGTGFLSYRWQGYDEAMFLYLLGLGSPTYPLAAESYAAWTSSYQWRRIYGHELLYSGPLFTHQISHLWFDLQGLRDEYMRGKDSDYFENSRRATYVQQRYAIENPRGFSDYGETCWGISASDGPGPDSIEIGGRKREFFDYLARGVPDGPDDGTIAPWAVVASLPFAPGIVLPTLDYFINHVDLKTEDRLGFKATFNPTHPDRSKNPFGWVSPWQFGLNQGPIVLMIENYRSGLPWRLMRSSPYVTRGLRRAGFTGGWLDASDGGRPPATQVR